MFLSGTVSPRCPATAVPRMLHANALRHVRAMGTVSRGRVTAWGRVVLHLLAPLIIQFIDGEQFSQVAVLRELRQNIQAGSNLEPVCD